MSKIRFLCCNHREWLAQNLAAAQLTWSQSHGQSLDSAEDANYLEAARHAGAAYEAAEIRLLLLAPPEQADIERFIASSNLLLQSLQRLDETELAHAVWATSVAHLEQLMQRGIEQPTANSGCEHLLRWKDESDNALATQLPTARPKLRAH